MSSIVDIAAFSARISRKTIWTFVRVRDEQGGEGWGEATLPGESAAVHAHVERLARQRVGGPVTPAARAPDLASAAEAAAVSAIDQAVWDLHAQRQGKALAEALAA